MKPSTAEIKFVIQKIESRLREPHINLLVNQPLKLGFREALRILENDITTYAHIHPMRDRKSQQIAILAVEFLQGEVDASALTEIQLRVPFGYTGDVQSLVAAYS